MPHTHLAAQRLSNQRLSHPVFETPAQVVSWLGAVQSQDFTGGKWAVGQRTPGLTDAAVEQAVAGGSILRLHILRPTWHFVTPDDIRWMLMLTAPRVKAQMASYYRDFDLHEDELARSRDVFIKALQGGQALTRAELTPIFAQAGFKVDSALRFAHIIVWAELDGLICSGAWRGKQPTYSLLAERAPESRTLEGDEALAELARRYFTSHGPATLKDYVWWSGLLVGDARAGLEMVKSELASEEVDGQTYWFNPSLSIVTESMPTAHLLPNYDEYIIGYTDRSAIFQAAHTHLLDSRQNVVFNHTVVMDGQIVGTWKRISKRRTEILEASLFMPPTESDRAALDVAAHRYSQYLGLSVELSVVEMV